MWLLLRGPGKFDTHYGDRVGIVEESCGYRGQYSGEIRFIEKPGVQDEGGRHMAECSSDPRVAYPEVKVQVRDLV